jgi:hypothetical protein
VIELPEDPAPNGVDVDLVDFGATLRPGGGASILRLNRPGTRLRLSVSYPPMTPDVARVFNRRLMTAKREGLRIDYPLLGLSQGAPGSPVIDGANPAGTTLPLRGLTPGYPVKEGYVLTLIDGDGNRYTHFSGNSGFANTDGEFTIEDIEPPLRGVFDDGDEVLLAKPTFEGAVTEGIGWSLAVDRLVRRGAQIVIEESAGLSPDLVS